MNPRIISLLQKGHEEKVKESDYLAWLFGNYVFSAVRTAVEQCLAGRDAKSQYIEKPLLQMVEEKEEISEEERIKMENEKLRMTLKIKQINWELNHS